MDYNTGIPVNILLVDDKEENIFSLQNLLTQDSTSQINFLHANSGNEALKVAYKEDLALVLLDVQMPGMDGYEVAHLLKQKKSTQNVPIIFVTALSAESKYVAEGYLKGAVDYLFKPLDPVITRAKVHAFINLYEQQKKLEYAFRNLELIVKKRTEDLEQKNSDLNAEVKRRQEAEQQLHLQNEKLEEKNKDLDQFVYVASHDLKLPINNLEGLLTLLKGELGSVNDGAQKIFHMLGMSLIQMRDTISGLINIIANKQQDTNFELLDSCQVLDEVKMSISQLIEDNQAQIYFDDSECGNFTFNRTVFKSILYNLISNAIKYRKPMEPPVVTITFKKESYKHVLSVKDNGVGMNEDEQQKLFTLFERLHTDQQVEGTGMGLYNMKNILDRYHASIKVLSSKGLGTEFLIYFN